MNSSYLNMAAGAFLGTVFVVMSVSIVSEALIHAEAPEQAGFVIEVSEAEDAGGAAEEQGMTPIANLLQTADAAAGAESFRKCAACHSIEEGGANGVGPALWGVVNRPIASVEGFNYSAALVEFSEGGEQVWDYEHLAGFLHDPRGYVSGTAMGFAGLSREDELANVIAYLREQSSDPAPLPEPVEETAEASGGEGEAAADGGSDMGPAVALLAEADAENGESVFRRCQACHSAEEGGPNRVGPNLWDVVERPVASVEDFNYSNAMVEYSQGGEVAWTFNRLDAFLLSPGDEVDGTSMGFAGISNDEDRADLLAYLQTLSNEPVALPGAGGDASAAEEEAAAASEDAPAEDQAAADAEAGEETTSDDASSEAAAGGDAASSEGDAASSEQEGSSGDTAASEEADPSTQDGGTAEEATEESGTSETDAAPAEEEASAETGGEAGSVAAMVADADLANGESVFAQCSACHNAEEGAGSLVGPNLWDVVNRDVAGVEDFQYTENFQTYGGEDAVWDYALLDQFLTAPMEEVPGTMMAYPGIEDAGDRADLIGYLRSLSNEPAPL